MMNKEEMYQLYKSNIHSIRMIEMLSAVSGMLDDQKYLDWKDELNRLSIDPDRENTSS